KRSEDVRARLLVLSEMHAVWTEACHRWREHNARHRDPLLDANTEYLYYQTLVGAWPIDLERIAAYMEKAVREAKEHSEWTRINEPYEKSLYSFIERTLADADFVRELEQMVNAVI